MFLLDWVIPKYGLDLSYSKQLYTLPTLAYALVLGRPFMATSSMSVQNLPNGAVFVSVWHPVSGRLMEFAAISSVDPRS